MKMLLAVCALPAPLCLLALPKILFPGYETVEVGRIALVEASGDLGGVRSRSAEGLHSVKNRFLRVHVRSAGVEVERGIAVFRPGVRGNMRSGDNHDPADAVGRKPAEGNSPHLGPGGLRGFDQDLLDLFHAADDFRVAGRGLDDIMMTDGLHNFFRHVRPPVRKRHTMSHFQVLSTERRRLTPDFCMSPVYVS